MLKKQIQSGQKQKSLKLLFAAHSKKILTYYFLLNIGALTQHKKKAHGVLPAGRQFQCDLCTKAPYSTKKSLKRHKLAVHGEAAAAGGNTAPKSKSNGKQKQSIYSGIIVSISSDDSDNDQKTTPHEVKKVKFSPKKSPGPPGYVVET